MTPFDPQQFLDELFTRLACKEEAQQIHSEVEGFDYHFPLTQSYLEFVDSISDLIHQFHTHVTGSTPPSEICHGHAIESLTSLMGDSPINLYLDFAESGFIEWENLLELVVNYQTERMISDLRTSTLEIEVTSLDKHQSAQVRKVLAEQYAGAGAPLARPITRSLLAQSILQLLECG